MLLTNDELELVREAVAIQSGMDQELVKRCGPLIHINAFDDAVQKAFVVLEERMRLLMKKEKLTGGQMVQYGFSPEGPFTKMIADSKERQGFQDLLTGAFNLYRNATAHTIVGYSGADARAIIGLIDLLLRRVDHLATLPKPGILPENVEKTLLLIQEKSTANIANQVRVFLAKCANLGMEIDAAASTYIPFKKRPLTKRDNWKKAKPHPLAVFYLWNTGKDQLLWFPVKSYYKYVVGLNTDEISKRLRELGFQPIGTAQEPSISVQPQTEKDYYDRLFAEVKQIVKEMEATLH